MSVSPFWIGAAAGALLLGALLAALWYRRQARAERVLLEPERYVAPTTQIDPPHAPLNEINHLIQAGRKLEAIQLYQQETGAALPEAKAAVEALDIGISPATFETALRTPLADLEAELHELLAQNKKISAIRLYRKRTGLNLKASRMAIEEMMASGNLAPLPADITVFPDNLDSVALEQEIRALLAQNKKISAVELYRDQTGSDLNAAKIAVERLEQHNG